MDGFMSLRRRRTHDHLTWQQLRDWQLRDIQRLRQWPRDPRDSRDLRVWVTALQYNELISLQDKMLLTPSPPDSRHRAVPIAPEMDREWMQSDFSYMTSRAAASWRGAGHDVSREAAALAAAGGVLLLLALAALLETCGVRIVPRRCSRKSRSEPASPPAALPAPALDLPPPYSPPAGQASGAGERPPPAYSEIYVQIPNLKVFYENEMQDAAVEECERDRFNDEVNETVMNYTLEHAMDVEVEEIVDESTCRSDVVVV